MIRQLGDDKVKFKLALSLHAANDTKRHEIMPINDTNNIAALIEAVVTVPPLRVLQAAVTQTVVRFGMPPGIPAADQSTARLGSMMPDQGWRVELRVGLAMSAH